MLGVIDTPTASPIGNNPYLFTNRSSVNPQEVTAISQQSWVIPISDFPLPRYLKVMDYP